jgi:hypothetical protein
LTPEPGSRRVLQCWRRTAIPFRSGHRDGAARVPSEIRGYDAGIESTVYLRQARGLADGLRDPRQQHLWGRFHRGGKDEAALISAKSLRDQGMLAQLRTGLRCRFAVRLSVAAAEWSSLSSAHRTHLAAKRPQVALLSGERASLAIVRHSPANFLNSSDGFIESSSLCRILVLSNVRLHFSWALERGDDCTNVNSRLDAVVKGPAFV